MRLSTVQYTSLGHDTSYDFDGNGGLIGVSLDAGPAWGSFDADALAMGGPPRAPWRATFTRDGLGNESQRSLPGGVVSRWDRQAMGLPRVQSITQRGASVGAVGYRWSSAEQLAALMDSQMGPTKFEHDARGYLVSATRPDGSVQHRAPDAVGNVYRSVDRTDRVYAQGGRLAEAAGVRYVSDDDGQLVEKVLPDGRSWKYAWDLAGQLVEVTRPDGQKVSFAYDALGRRVRKSFAGRATRYVWDGNDLVHEVTDSAAAVSWVFEPGTFALLARRIPTIGMKHWTRRDAWQATRPTTPIRNSDTSRFTPRREVSSGSFLVTLSGNHSTETTCSWTLRECMR